MIETERVEPLLEYLKTGVFMNRTNMTFMKAYTVVVQFGDQQQHSLKLYTYYKKVITEYCEGVYASMCSCTGEELLRRLSELWEKNTILVFWMQRVFQYLDRFFTKNSNEHPDLFSAALHSFQKTVYDKIRDRCISAMLEAIDRDRSGYDIDQGVVRLLVEMLCTVGDSQPRIVKQKGVGGDRLEWHSGSKGCYKSDFETPLLAATTAWYKTKVAGWIAEYSCPRFLDEVTRRLEDEERRVHQYLDRSSHSDLVSVAQHELILSTAKTLVEMESGCQAMFQGGRQSELALMYRLFKREPTVLPHITDTMQPYIEGRCSKVVEDQQKIDNPTEYVEQVLELKREFDDMVATCFENDSSFQKARNKGMEAVLNKDTRCAKYLALFCDFQLKKGLKGKSEDETTSLVNQIVSLFAHLRDKDIFLDFYKRALSKRLLSKLSVSTDTEDAFITKLKVECGQQAIQKLASMFTDMTLSDGLQEQYNKLSHGGAPGGVTHDVRILQTNAWPEKAEDVSVMPCEEMLRATEAFESFYNSKHSGRKLRWMYNMGTVELKSHCFPRSHTLVVSTYQCLVLMLLNSHKEVTFRQICNATKIPDEECHRQVLSMTVQKHRLLLRKSTGKELDDNSVLEVNTQFTSEKMKVSVGLIKREEKAAEVAVAEAPVERKHVVDAAIVRIMKARKKLEHNALLEEVFRQCTLFKPQPSQVKVQIEHLIEREFLKRDSEKRNVYIYLP